MSSSVWEGTQNLKVFLEGSVTSATDNVIMQRAFEILTMQEHSWSPGSQAPPGLFSGLRAVLRPASPWRNHKGETVELLQEVGHDVT